MLSCSLEMLGSLGITSHYVKVTAEALMLEAKGVTVVSSLTEGSMKDSPSESLGCHVMSLGFVT